MVNNDDNLDSSGQTGCAKNALTDFFGLVLQVVLAGLAFTCLIGTKDQRNFSLSLFFS